MANDAGRDGIPDAGLSERKVDPLPMKRLRERLEKVPPSPLYSRLMFDAPAGPAAESANKILEGVAEQTGGKLRWDQQPDEHYDFPKNKWLRRIPVVNRILTKRTKFDEKAGLDGMQQGQLADRATLTELRDNIREAQRWLKIGFGDYDRYFDGLLDKQCDAHLIRNDPKYIDNVKIKKLLQHARSDFQTKAGELGGGKIYEDLNELRDQSRKLAALEKSLSDALDGKEVKEALVEKQEWVKVDAASSKEVRERYPNKKARKVRRGGEYTYEIQKTAEIEKMRDVPAMIEDLQAAMNNVANRERDKVPERLRGIYDAMRTASKIVDDKIAPELAPGADTFLTLVAYVHPGSFLAREMLKQQGRDVNGPAPAKS